MIAWTLYRFAHHLAHPWIQRELASYPTLPRGEGGVWVHVASVGELHGIAPFLERLSGDLPLWISATTPRGFERATQLLGDRAEIFRFPLDHPGEVRAVFQRHPRALVLVETELWPNLLGEAYRRGIPLFLLNGRLTETTFRTYRLIGGWRPILRAFRRLFVQTQWDGWRFWKLGARREAIRVTGNWKRYLPPIVRRAWKREDFGLGSEPVVLFASLRGRELEGLLPAMVHLKRRIPEVRWILAPRHFSWMDHLLEGLRRFGFSFRRWREGRKMGDADTLVVDVIGELPGLYGVADVVVVGGTFADYGGHNLMEPVHAERPVIFGPFTAHVRDMRTEILEYCAGIQTDMEGLGPVLEHFFSDAAFRNRLDQGVARLRTASYARLGKILQEVEEVLHDLS